MDERVSTFQTTLPRAGLSLLRAAGVPASLDGAGRTLPITQSCLSKAQGAWPDAPFLDWVRAMGEANAELERAKQGGLADPIALIAGADASNPVLQEVQRWTMSAATAHEASSMALIGRALVVCQQARSVLPAELLRGLHTLRLAKMQKGRRSRDWDALLDTDLTSADQVLQRLESTPPQSPTRDFLAALSVVLSTAVQPPNRTEAFKSNEHPNGADDPTEEPATAEQVSSSADRGTAQLDSEEVTPDEGQGLPGNAPEKSTSPRISARLAAGACYPMAGSDDAPQLLGVDVQQLAGRLVLVAHHRFDRIKVAELGQACTGQYPADGGLAEANAVGNVRLQHAPTAQLDDQQGRGGIDGSGGTRRARGCIGQGGWAASQIAAQPLPGRRRCHAVLGSGFTGTEAGFCHLVRIPLIVTSDSGNVTADSGDRDRAWCCAS